MHTGNQAGLPLNLPDVATYLSATIERTTQVLSAIDLLTRDTALDRAREEVFVIRLVWTLLVDEQPLYERIARFFIQLASPIARAASGLSTPLSPKH